MNIHILPYWYYYIMKQKCVLAQTFLWSHQYRRRTSVRTGRSPKSWIARFSADIISWNKNVCSHGYYILFQPLCQESHRYMWPQRCFRMSFYSDDRCPTDIHRTKGFDCLPLPIRCFRIRHIQRNIPYESPIINLSIQENILSNLF